MDDFDDSDFDHTDTDDDSADATAPCPACGAEIYDDAERCPRCGQYLSREDAPRSPAPAWIIAGVAIGVVIVVLWVLLGR